MRTKDEVQLDIISQIKKKNLRGIVLASVRSGKTRILLQTIKQDSEFYYEDFKNIKILVLYPNLDIKKSWLDECDILGYHPNITYCTFASLSKVTNELYDYVIVDEAHLLGEENQLPMVVNLVNSHKKIILASGTYTGDTLKALTKETELKLIVNYPIDAAIKDGIICDFNIIVHQYKLDDKIPVVYGKVKKWTSTELKECRRLTKKVNHTFGKEKIFSALTRMHFINNNSSLVSCVSNWIANHPDERFLLFAGSENVGKRFNLPMFNSKSLSNLNLELFLSGDINQLCLIKKGSAGITYPNLKTILITAINSNGENLEQMLGRSLLLDTEKADIHIFVSDQDFQINWLNVALGRINKEKITYICEE